jgi:ribosomal protein S18 acetylase RimI-like enzyme
MLISSAEPADAPEILAIVHAAFRPVAEQYGMASLPPLEDTLEDLLAEVRTHVILKAVDDDGRIVGSIRGRVCRGTCEVGRLAVEPGVQGRGIGTALAREIEARFPEVDRFELFTGHLSDAPLRLYRGLGYVPFRVEPVSDTLQLVYLSKPGPGKKGKPARR